MPVLSLLLVVLVFSCGALSLTPSERADIYLDTPELISKYGYPAETHTLTTSDGYILNMHRIPHSLKSPSAPGKPVVLLQHGMMASSADYVVPNPDYGLAFLLADAGFDVFLGNSRGNTYSRKHVNLTAEDPEFWGFSWHEMGIHDLPTEIDYILNKTNQEQIYYIGMSMGTTIFFVLMSERPEYNEKVKLMVALAPIAFFDNTSKTINATRKTFAPLLHLAYILQLKDLNIPNWITEFWSESVCPTSFGFESCFLKFFFGLNMSVADSGYLNKSVLPVASSHFPAGLSSDTALHYMQLMETGKFEHRNYGSEENLLKYKQEEPPPYNVSAIKTPVAMFHSEGDGLSTPKEVQYLCNMIPNCIELYEVTRKNFTHMEFVLGLAVDVKFEVYDKVLDLLISK